MPSSGSGASYEHPVSRCPYPAPRSLCVLSVQPLRSLRSLSGKASPTARARALSIPGGLHGEQFSIQPALRDELVVRAFFDDFAAFEDDDAVGHADGGEAVGDQNGGAAG